MGIECCVQTDSASLRRSGSGPVQFLLSLGLLAVFSEHGDLVGLSEFQNWYDNEHIPLCLDHFSTFLTGTRYSATDEKSPSWLALYDIADLSDLQHESYTRLRTNRSEREADLIRRLDVLDRRICEVVWDSGEQQSSKTTSLRVENASTVIATHGLERHAVEDVAIVMWAEEVTVQNLRGKEEWVRTRVFRFKMGVNEAARSPKAYPFFVLHEFLSRVQWSESGINESLPEVRKWELYRAYQSLSQKA